MTLMKHCLVQFLLEQMIIHTVIINFPIITIVVLLAHQASKLRVIRL